MKVILMAALLFIGTAVASAQLGLCKQVTDVDWTQLNPKVLDMAFDLLDDINLQADAVEKSDEVYSPREADSQKLHSKLARIRTSEADKEVFCPLSEYHFMITSRRHSLGMPGACDSDSILCPSARSILDYGVKVTAMLHEIQGLYDAAQKRKPEAPAAR
jgi:hypothetical protein